MSLGEKLKYLARYAHVKYACPTLSGSKVMTS